MEKIGFIGVGIMGKSMVRNLMKAGYELHIYARHPEKVADVVEEGAHLHESIAACVAQCPVVISIVGFPQDVEEVYFAPGNILDAAEKGAYLIDMTTTSPSLAERIYACGRERGLRVLDAPVTGGDTGPKPERCPFWWAATGRIMRPACRYFVLWGQTSIIREKLAAVSMPSWPIRS